MATDLLIPVELSGGTRFLIQASTLGLQQVATPKATTFNAAKEAIVAIGSELTDAIQQVRPQTAEVEFTIAFAIETGQLTALLVKGEGSGNLRIKLSWTSATTNAAAP